MAKYTYEGHEYQLYKYDDALDFFFRDENEEKKFQQLVKKHGDVEKIPGDELMQGRILYKRTNKTDGWLNTGLSANKISF